MEDFTGDLTAFTEKANNLAESFQAEDIDNLSSRNPLEAAERDFIYKFAVWIYRAIIVFKNDKRNNTDIVYHSKIVQVGNGSFTPLIKLNGL